MTAKPVVVIHINGPGGKLMDLSVYRNDNPSVVAKQFLEENNLPIHLVPAIAQKIAHSVLEASRKRVGDHAISPPPQSPVTSSPSIEPSSPEVYNEMRSIEVTSPEETQFNEIRRSSFSPKYSDEIKGIKRVDSRAMSTGSLRRANSANSLSRPNSRLEQLYLSADKYRDHREELRRKMEEERQAAIIESDFRVQLGTKSPSRWKAHVEHAKHIFRGDNYFEALYEDSKVRNERKQRSMELAELERRKREDEACRPVPKLESRAGMRHAPSPNTAAIYSGLYSWKFSRENSLNDLKKKYEQRPSFSPTLYGRTVELARKRRSRSLSRSQSPSATARSQDARIAVPTPAVEFTPLHDHMSLTFSQLQGDQNEHHDDVRASSPLVASMEATTIGAHSGDGSIADTVPTEVEHSDDGKAPSSTVDGEGINFNIDETALQTLRTLQPTQPSTTTDADVARFFSPFSNRTLNVRLPQPQSSDSHPESFHESNHPELGQNSENYGDMNDRAISPLSENSFQIRYNQQHSPLRGRSPPKRPNLKLDLKLVSEQSVSSETVFDRLYAERNNKEAIQMELQKRHSYSHPHRPDIGSSSNRPIEKSTNAFFNRLYNHYAVRQQEILRRSIELQKMRELEVVDNSVCIPLGRQLESMERLHQLHQRQLDHQVRREAAARPVYIKSFCTADSELIMRNHSLDEIFEVLLVTAQYRMEERGGHREKSEERREEGREEAKAGVENRGDAGEEYTSDFYEEDEGSSGDSIVLSDLDAVEDYGATPTNNSSSKIQPSIAVISLRKPVPAPDPPAPPSAAHAPVSASRAQRRPGGATQGEKKKRKKVHRPHRLDAPPPDEGELLDTVLADASFLQPQSVCEVVQEALEKLKPNKVNKKAFRKQVNALIEAQQLVDVHKVLTSPTKRIPHRKEVEQEPLPSFAPTLCEESIKRASKVYANRSTRRQPVENSLLAYVDVYNERREELKKDVDEMELKELTLQPRCIAKYMRELHRTSVTAAKKQTNNNNKQSMKANDNASESSVIILDAPPPIRQRRQSWAGPSST